MVHGKLQKEVIRLDVDWVANHVMFLMMRN